MKINDLEYSDKLWLVIDELKRELNIKEDAIVDLNECIDDLKESVSSSSSINKAKMNNLQNENVGLISENKELKTNLKIKEDEKHEEWKENNNLRKKLNETISCKDYESEASEYFHHNPQGNKVSFFMFDEDYINQYDIDESLEICTIYNDNI
tara:strand:- start:240 stop:698 length:459 start_codon:yes stop_codon:yes gene_type:complete